MHKKLICAVLSLLLMICLAFTAMAEMPQDLPKTLTISTREEFLTFAENCRLDTYSQGLSVALEADIDLTGTNFAAIPTFSGRFYGKNHIVSGLTLTSAGSMQGLFRTITPEAIVQDLVVEGHVAPGGSRREVGGVVGVNSGTIRNCIFRGTVSGSDSVGAIAGRNAVAGLIENSSSEGQIIGDHAVGGIAGANQGVIRSCSSSASVNVEAKQNTVDLSDITLDTITNSESANTVTDIGGIAGTSNGVIRNCENLGAVGYRNMGYNVGGIVGTQSGYITGCKNHGPVHGRKEVGGIVGQMEPASQIEYSQDTLQILKGQLNTMSGMTGRASANARANAGKVNSEINKLKEQVDTAQNAVNSIIPPEGSNTLPDPDKVQAAYNVLSKTFSDMPTSLGRIASTTQTTVNGLSRDIKAISGQMDVMGKTLNSAEENLGGTITDISDLDTPEDLNGKVENCQNDGEVLADMNAGGIAGAIAMENDLDVLEDWQSTGKTSLNFSAELRAVILNSQNQGKVIANKQNVGGIAGWQSMGLVKNCISNGEVDGTGAENVGGISGLSTGYIRQSYAQCSLKGTVSTGGIAGSGTIVTDSLAMVQMDGCTEKYGGILGVSQTTLRETEETIARNYYLPVDKDLGAIDGVSYSGVAEPMSLEAFLSQSNLPDIFKTVTVSFLFDDGSSRKIAVTPGTDLSMSLVPYIPQREGVDGVWEGLDEEKLQNVMFDMAFQAVYDDHLTAISSVQTRNGRPLFLVEGAFTQKAVATAETVLDAPVLGERSVLLESWQIDLTEAGETIRFLLPEDPGELSLYLRTGDAWEKVNFKRDESYGVFPFAQTEGVIAIVSTSIDPLPRILMAVGIVLAIGFVVALLYRRSRKKKSTNHA